jgi:UPF0755 protein
MRAIVLMLVLLGAAGLLARDAWRLLNEPLAIPKGHLVELPRGGSLGPLLREWQAAGILTSDRQRLYLSAYARLTGQARNLKAGEYELGPGMRPLDLTALLVSGRVVLHELSLIEGWRFADVLALVERHDALRHTLPAGDTGAVMRALGHADLHPEGRFYPDTYRFGRGTTDVAFLQRAFDAMATVLAEEWATRADGLPYRSPDDALTMASIVERETGAIAERPEIAGVFVRRLQLGMRLQTDPTVIYGLGAAFDGNLRKRDLLADTPYNTYTRGGLPPTPICLPGRAALHAALHPAPGKTLYFVSRGDGSHQFSETIRDHAAAVRQYQLKRRRR